MWIMDKLYEYLEIPWFYKSQIWDSENPRFQTQEALDSILKAQTTNPKP